jgi:hypothetical protein
MTEEVKSERKDKKIVEGEVFDDDRIRGFLNVLPPVGCDPDYHALEIAYRGMRAEDFARFVTFFLEAGRNIDAKNPQDKTLLQVLSKYRLAAEYAACLSAIH